MPIFEMTLSSPGSDRAVESENNNEGSMDISTSQNVKELLIELVSYNTTRKQLSRN